MTEEDYVKERLDDQQTWYSRKSQYNQNCFKRLRMVEIVSAAIIPFLSGMAGKIDYSQWFIGGLGVLIAVSAAITELFKYQENWIKYRTTAEQLKHEKFIYLTNAKPYDTKDKFTLLVERVELLISKENSAWATMSQTKVESQQIE